jgi:hypothetical protein
MTNKVYTLTKDGKAVENMEKPDEKNKLDVAGLSGDYYRALDAYNEAQAEEIPVIGGNFKPFQDLVEGVDVESEYTLKCANCGTIKGVFLHCEKCGAWLFESIKVLIALTSSKQEQDRENVIAYAYAAWQKVYKEKWNHPPTPNAIVKWFMENYQLK